MGQQFLDQYTLLHFSSGVVAYFWGLDFLKWLLVHLGFELAENSETGMKFINAHLKSFWPGGKPRADGGLNILGDNMSAMAGWFCASRLDRYGKANDWYTL